MTGKCINFIRYSTLPYRLLSYTVLSNSSVAAKVNWIGNVSENNMSFVPFQAKRYGKTSYLLKIEPQDGEYGVRVLNPNERDEKVLMFYCFGIH